MMLEPAQRAGDAPRTAPEQGTPEESPRPVVHLNATSDPPIRNTENVRALPVKKIESVRLPAFTPEARRRSERQQWLGRRRLERQLHDGAALRISALTLQIGLIRHRAPAAGAGLDESIDALQDELHAILEELRDVAGQIYPPLLDEAGLGPALREVADCIAPHAEIHVSGERFDPAAEGATYFAIAECLDSLDADAPSVNVVISHDVDPEGGTVLAATVAPVDLRHAEPMHERVWRLGGTIDVTGGVGVGTITMRIPCE